MDLHQCSFRPSNQSNFIWLQNPSTWLLLLHAFSFTLALSLFLSSFDNCFPFFPSGRWAMRYNQLIWSVLSGSNYAKNHHTWTDTKLNHVIWCSTKLPFASLVIWNPNSIIVSRVKLKLRKLFLQKIWLCLLLANIKSGSMIVLAHNLYHGITQEFT